MKIVVCSHNPVKLQAVRDAFEAVFPSDELNLIPLSVDPGVSEQPNSDEETHRGACNRVLAARQKLPDADYWVGLEGGLEWSQSMVLASAWMVIQDRGNRVSEARTPTLPLPPAVRELLQQGHELGEANDRVFDTRNSKQAAGAFGLLTQGRMTRRSVYAQTLELALIPMVHPLWQGSG